MEATTICRINEEAFKSWLNESLTMKDRFRWNITSEDALKMLQAAYKRSVEVRGSECEIPADVVSHLSTIAEFMTTPGRQCGVVLCGQCGNGKTTTMNAFVAVTKYVQGVQKHLAMKEGRGLPPNFTLENTSARRISQIAKDAEAMNTAKRATVLCIDDLGLEPTEVLDFGNAINPVIEIIEQRYNRQLFTFITTNLTPAQIREKYGDRIADRFNEMMKCIVYKNSTFRR